MLIYEVSPGWLKSLQNVKLAARIENNLIFFCYEETDCYENCLSQFLEQSRTGSHSAVTNLYKNIPEHSDPYVITQIRNCVKLLNLAPNRGF